MEKQRRKYTAEFKAQGTLRLMSGIVVLFADQLLHLAG
jgi:hypothetical protein